MRRPSSARPPRPRYTLLVAFAALAAPAFVASCGASGRMCQAGGQAHAPGETFADRGCSACTCQPDGSVVCDETSCKATCRYAGVGRTAGASFPSRDGCNTCTCEESGVVSCTQKACACDPKKEWFRSYAGDPEACMRIRFVCPAATEYFSSTCGCGCEQGADCPQTFACPPGDTVCDPQAMKTRCPYTEVKP